MHSHVSNGFILHLSIGERCKTSAQPYLELVFKSFCTFPFSAMETLLGHAISYNALDIKIRLDLAVPLNILCCQYVFTL